jgi:superoxide dismutase, Fe-Mn family
MAHTYDLPPLPYGYDALEPHLSAQIMRLHHDHHHLGYVNGLNQARARLDEAHRSGDRALIRHWSREAAVHGSGHYLHCIFWTNMAPPGNGGEPSGVLAEQVVADFGSLDRLRAAFTASAGAVEGDGWTVLAWEPDSRSLQILQVERHHHYARWGAVPVLALDVWEHAYYLQYRADRNAYIDAWWAVINWADVAERLKAAQAAAQALR